MLHAHALQQLQALDCSRLLLANLSACINTQLLKDVLVGKQGQIFGEQNSIHSFNMGELISQLTP